MKNLKTIILSMGLMIAVIVSASAQQPNQRMKKMNATQQGPYSRLSDAQKESLKSIKSSHEEGMKKLKNEISEALAHQKTLMGNANPDEKEILKGVAKISAMKGEMAKKSMAIKLEVRKVIDPEMDGMRHMMTSKGKGRVGQEHGVKGHSPRMRAQGMRSKSNGMGSGAMRNKQAPGLHSKKGDRQQKGSKNREGLMARKGHGKNDGAKHDAMFTDEQKAAMKNLRLKNHQSLTDLQNRLNELQVHQKTIASQKTVDLKEAYKNIDKMTQLKTEIAQIHAKARLEMKAMLTPEQQLKMNSMKKRAKYKMHHIG